jgi:hypothetical protein
VRHILAALLLATFLLPVASSAVVAVAHDVLRADEGRRFVPVEEAGRL